MEPVHLPPAAIKPLLVGVRLSCNSLPNSVRLRVISGLSSSQTIFSFRSIESCFGPFFVEGTLCRLGTHWHTVNGFSIGYETMPRRQLLESYMLATGLSLFQMVPVDRKCLALRACISPENSVIYRVDCRIVSTAGRFNL